MTCSDKDTEKQKPDDSRETSDNKNTKYVIVSNDSNYREEKLRSHKPMTAKK